jgi:hypothetical protein
VKADEAAAADAGHPVACPWCGQTRVRGVTPSPDGKRWYRCAACTTTFFFHPAPGHPMTPESENRRGAIAH